MKNIPPLPEMVVIDQHIPSGYAIRGYTSKEMYAYGQQCREAALEEAARLVEKYFDVNEPWINPHDIRDLK